MDFVSSSGVTDKTDVQNSPQVTVNTKTYVNSKYFNIFWLYAHVTIGECSVLRSALFYWHRLKERSQPRPRPTIHRMA